MVHFRIKDVFLKGEYAVTDGPAVLPGKTLSNNLTFKLPNVAGIEILAIEVMLLDNIKVIEQ